jgi:hypothetical protein
MIPAALSRRLALLSLCASALGLAACGGGSSSDAGTAQLRALNLTADLPSIDLYTDTTKQFSAVATDALGSYSGVGAATYTLKVNRAGDGTTLLSGSYTLSKDQHYTAVVWGRETALRLSTLPEDEDNNNITTGNSRLRIFNATTDTGALDVFVTSSTADIGETSPTQGALASGSLSGFRDLSAGTYRLRVTGVGDPNDVRLDVPAFTLADKKHNTLILTAGGSGVLVNGTQLEQQSTGTSLKNTKARVRVVASMNAAGNVAVSVGGTTLVGGLRSPSVGPYALVNAGNLNLTVRVNGNVISDATQSFVAGNDYTLMTYGLEGAGQVKVLADDNRLPSSTSRVKVRLVHGLAGVDPLTLSVDYLALATDQLSGAASAYATTNAANSVRIDVTSASAPAALYSATEVNLQGQGVYTVFMLGGNAAPTGVIRKER